MKPSLIPRRKRFDAVIVGGRVAGASTALLLASAGLRVLIVDQSPKIGDTLSTHALMRPAVELLGQWGLLETLVRADTPWVREAHFQYGADRISIPLKQSGAVEGLIAPRRWLLDQTVLDASVAAGAELALGTSYVQCHRDAKGRVIGAVLRRPDGTDEAVATELLIGADGRRSRVAETVCAKTLDISQHRTATIYGYFSDIPNEGYRWYFGDGVTAGVIPTTAGMSCVFASCRPAEYRSRFGPDAPAGMARVIGSFDLALGEQVAASRAQQLRRFLGAPGMLRARTGRGWALVGDAAFFRDPTTAHGITDAFLDAHVLSTALNVGDLGTYASTRDAQAGPLFDVTQRIASFDWDLDLVKALHVELNACMKAEQVAITRQPPLGSDRQQFDASVLRQTATAAHQREMIQNRPLGAAMQVGGQ